MVHFTGDYRGPAPAPQAEVQRLGAAGPNLATAIAWATATRRHLALLHIDIDGLGAINATMGEDVGDQTLSAIAQRLAQAMPTGSWLWRLGSDEFIAAVGFRPGEPDGHVLAEQLGDSFSQVLHVPPYALDVSLTIGIALFPEHALDAGGLLAAAEQALRRAKRAGLGVVHTYTAEPAQEAPAENPAQQFVDALAQSEFRLYYQPVVSAQDGSIAACSTLLRWHTKHDGLLRPGRFMHAVERAGLAGRVGYWTVETAARQMREWRDRGIDYLAMSVHLDGVMLADPRCLDQIGDLLHRHDLPGSALEFEVCESVLAMDTIHVFENLSGLSAGGSRLSLADFGMGGLSLAALAQFPIDRLKIDRAFLRNVAHDPRAAAMVRGIIAMGHRLGMTVVVKGVETEAEFNFLRRNQCDFFQGYLFSPPLPAGKLDEVVRGRFLRPQAFDEGEPQAERVLLLLDDEENVLRSLVRVFRREGYRLLTANSVHEAFDMLASHHVQVIVSDQRMPDMTGTEFLSRVRDLYPGTMRLVLSGYTDLDTITEAINQGAIYRFLTKPWNDDELREHIRAAFSAHAGGRDGTRY